jgi:hypothetical protein
MDSNFKAKLSSFNKKPKRRVLKRFSNKKVSKKASQQTIVHKREDSSGSSSTPFHQKQIEDLPSPVETLKSSSPKNKAKKRFRVLSISSVNDIPMIQVKQCSTPLPVSTVKPIIEHESKSATNLQHQSDINQDTEHLQSQPKSEVRLNIGNISPKKATTEQLIAQSMAELAKINEEVSLSDASSQLPDPSPKVTVGITDTWDTYSTKLDETCKEIVDDMNDLELRYKLRENWHEAKATLDKPFPSEVSIILTPHYRKGDSE